MAKIDVFNLDRQKVGELERGPPKSAPLFKAQRKSSTNRRAPATHGMAQLGPLSMSAAAGRTRHAHKTGVIVPPGKSERARCAAHSV
jgi:hypothetical protein